MKDRLTLIAERFLSQNPQIQKSDVAEALSLAMCDYNDGDSPYAVQRRLENDLKDLVQNIKGVGES